MKILGIIAEFNPLHNGHDYFLTQAKSQSEADYTIVVMSGDFTQRGEPAIYDKFLRTKLALRCGADMVIELPVAAAASSAQDFARCGTALLCAAGADTLAFGCENADLDILSSLAAALAGESPDSRSVLKEGLKKGLSWPEARSSALGNRAGTSVLIKQPNNILALEYLSSLDALRASGSRIRPLAIQRIRADYHDPAIHPDISSATAIRARLFDSSRQPDLSWFPASIRPDMEQILDNCIPFAPDDLSAAMICRLLQLSAEDLLSYLDMDTGLGRRIFNHRNLFTDFTSFCQLVTTRAYTAARVRRVLLHTLLDIRTTDRSKLKALSYAPYLRILGIRREAKPLLSIVASGSHIPVITRPAAFMTETHDPQLLQRQHLFSLDIHAADIYRSIHSIKTKSVQKQELQQPLIVL